MPIVCCRRRRPAKGRSGNAAAALRPAGADAAKAPVAVVTGASAGIGLHTAGLLAARGFRVVLACRSEERTKQAVKEMRKEYGEDLALEYAHLDLARLASVRDFVVGLGDQALNLLVCNAGMPRSGVTAEDTGVDLAYQTNYLSHFMLVLLLLPRLRQAPGGGRVVSITSVMHRWARLADFDHLANVSMPYALSKLAQLLMTFELARRETVSGAVSFHAVNPGYIRSDIWSKNYCCARFLQYAANILATSSQRAAGVIVAICADAECAPPSAPGYWNGYMGAARCRLLEYYGPLYLTDRADAARPSTAARDEALARQVWDQSLATLRECGFHDPAWADERLGAPAESAEAPAEPAAVRERARAKP